MDAALTIGGIALLAFVMVEVYFQLFHPERGGTLSQAIFRAMRAIARRFGRRAVLAAGPLSLVLVLGSWIAMTIVGWVLVLLPRIPEQLDYGTGIDRDGSIIDAAYVSMVAVTTLGFGDIVPNTSFLRIALPLEAAMGFGLLTAGLAWILSTYRPLVTQRSLARLARIHLADDAPLGRQQLDDFAARVVGASLDLQLTQSTYYLEPARTEDSMAVAALALHEAATRASNGGDDETRRAATRLLRALAGLADDVADAHLPSTTGKDPSARLRAWCRDARLDAAS